MLFDVVVPGVVVICVCICMNVRLCLWGGTQCIRLQKQYTDASLLLHLTVRDSIYFLFVLVFAWLVERQEYIYVENFRMFGVRG